MAPHKRARDVLEQSAPSTSVLRAEKVKKAKRSHEPGSYSTESAAPAGKKIKFGADGKEKDVSVKSSTVVADEVDFPRGGGVTLEQLNKGVERMEVDGSGEVFADGPKKAKAKKQPVGGTKDRKGKQKGEAAAPKSKSDTIRVEHLNYKRLEPGQKLLGQITSILPLALIVSLPNQLMGHVPIINISPQLTSRLESSPSRSPSPSSEAEEDEEDDNNNIPSLSQLFSPGQYVSCTVKQVRPASSTIDFGARPRDESEKAARRVELSIRPGDVNAGVGVGDLRVGFNISGAVQSVEDHGYTVDFGLLDVSGFIPYKTNSKTKTKRLSVGQVVSTTVTKISENKRLCTLSVKPEDVRDASLNEATSAHALLPGTLVSALVTAIVPSGLNVQILGFFNGTIELFHLPGGVDSVKIGDKIKARVLWDIPGSSPPRFALSLLPHVLNLVPASTLPPPPPQSKSKSKKKAVEEGVKLNEAYPVGMILESVKVVRVESEWGLVCEVGEGVGGFVHISQIADSLVPQLSSTSGTWREGSAHRARVTGYHALDGLVLLSLQPSVLELVYMRAGDVNVGDTLKGTITKLKENGLIVALSDKVTGFVGPDHYADIKLKHPERKFKEGATVKCRVLSVDADRSRVRLTLKKSLLESTLPILASFEDAKVGMVTAGVVQRIEERFVIVEYYGGVRALVPLTELTDTRVSSATGLFTTGQVVKTRLTVVDQDSHRITASIRQAAPSFQAPVDVSSVTAGSTVSGTITAVHDDNAVLSLDEPQGAMALISLSNLANSRGTTVPQLRASIEIGEKIEDLTVMSVNVDKSLVIISAAKPKSKAKPSAISSALRIDTLEEGQIVAGRVGATMASGTAIKLSNHVVGRLHPTDVCDDFSSPDAVPPPEGKFLDVAVIRVDKHLKRVDLSLRKSRLEPEAGHEVADREVGGVEELKVGETVRGFVKSVMQHGVFASLGKDVTARIQIKELFDEYVKEWQSRFSAGQVISARVLSTNTNTNQVELTMRSGELNKLLKHTVGLSDFHVGQKVEGRVKGVTDFGMFIEIVGTKISGLCHKSEISDNKKANVSEALKSFREDDIVKAVILSIDTSKRKISFGIKPSYFADEDFEMKGVEEADEEGSGSDEEQESRDEDAPEDEEGSGIETGSDDEETDSEDEIADAALPDEPMADLKPAAPSNNAPALSLSGGFSWSAQTGASHDANESISNGSDSDSEAETSKSKKKKKKKSILQDLTADLHTKVPESTADFERVVLGSPNSSFLWVQYMAFQVQLSEIEKAREIGRRALQTINYREEQEKLNVWMALLNLENQFGTDESLEVLFKEAARHNDSKTVYLRYAAILEESEKTQAAEEQFTRTAKKFSQSSKVWTLFGEHYLKSGKLEEARKLLPRSLLSLPQRKHLKTISTFARMEYKLGDPERGKTIFEGIVESHPKRNDLWSVYIDMEASQNNIQSIRNIFNRALSRKLTAKQAKFFFKKWLELERRIGDEAGADAVKEKAVAWTQRHVGGES
ncbi:rRNA biogenesis protein rrp5 [Ceratobasidium sp. 392]|nr:rRNA biogenesis protein rrp5 [Ceratobasidium sp. 392]